MRVLAEVVGAGLSRRHPAATIDFEPYLEDLRLLIEHHGPRSARAPARAERGSVEDVAERFVPAAAAPTVVVVAQIVVAR
jgi:hypothetical protein